MKRRIRDAALALLHGLAEFFNPREWVPSIPLPPVGPWEPKGRGVQTLREAIRGFSR